VTKSESNSSPAADGPSLMEEWLSDFDEGHACWCPPASKSDLEVDWFVFAPSMFMSEEQLQEGKSIGTAKEQDLVFLKHDQTAKADMDPDQYAWERHQGTTVGKRKLDKAKEEAYPKVLNAINQFLTGKLTEKEMRTQVIKTMKRAWKTVFFAGVRSSGIPGDFGKKWRMETTPEDEKWLKSAMSHEMRFLNKMLTQVVEGNYKMPLPRRVRMYVDALESFYNSARVMGVPMNTIFHWKLSPEGVKKDNICASCVYLSEHSPYTKKTLPTTPRSGMTLCLTNCRDKLVARRVPKDKIAKTEADSRYNQRSHIKNLRKIKRLGHL
jgi:hypothetical protein